MTCVNISRTELVVESQGNTVSFDYISSVIFDCEVLVLPAGHIVGQHQGDLGPGEEGEWGYGLGVILKHLAIKSLQTVDRHWT